MPILSRRTFAGAGIVVLAGAAGVAAEFLRHPGSSGTGSGPGSGHGSGKPTAAPPTRAPLVQAALARERLLVERLETAARATPALRPTIAILLADHRAHAAALAALVTEAGASPAGASTASPETGAPITAATARTWEKAAAAATVHDCAAATGPAAAVLASIYACEQTHVAWLG